MEIKSRIFTQAINEDEEMLPFVAISDDEEPSKNENFGDILPAMALKNTVLFPGVILPITVGRDKSMRAITKAYEGSKFISVLTQIDSKTEDPNFKDLYQIGTIARIVKLLRMPDGSQTVILQGRKRFLVTEIVSEDKYLECKIQLKEYVLPENALEYEATIKSIQERSKKIIELNPQIPNEAQLLLRNINNDRFLLNFISSNINIAISKKQNLLEEDYLSIKANSVLIHLNNELQLLEVKDQIENKVRGDLDKQQRDYFLNQQLKTIQEELGQDPQEQEVEELLAKAAYESTSWGIFCANELFRVVGRLTMGRHD